MRIDSDYINIVLTLKQLCTRGLSPCAQGASHVDLYDDEAGVIPYDKMEEFFAQNRLIK